MLEAKPQSPASGKGKLNAYHSCLNIRDELGHILLSNDKIWKSECAWKLCLIGLNVGLGINVVLKVCSMMKNHFQNQKESDVIWKNCLAR